ncbi:MAG: dTDP-4-dehydrorhamnose reductase [Deltaproteobacteria bacterium]|nr:dTDP-4-dehydrorhamnose reductase [Deltaproteobacteria bacterium]
MKILVMGANGQLGSDLKKFEIIPFTRRDVDVSDFKTLHTALKSVTFDVLVNCASYNRVNDAEGHAEEAFRINASAVGEMAVACRKKRARFVHVSTDFVFDGATTKPYVESDATGPINVYGASKCMGETLARLYGGDVITLRVASLFGVAGSSGKGGNFVETMMRLGKETGRLTVVNDITMSPTSTHDVARMIVTLLERGAAAGTYHAVNSGQATWYDFACEIIRRAHINADVIPVTSAEYPTRARRPLFSALDNTKITGVVGAIPHWTEALDRYLRQKGYST